MRLELAIGKWKVYTLLVCLKVWPINSCLFILNLAQRSHQLWSKLWPYNPRALCSLTQSLNALFPFPGVKYALLLSFLQREDWRGRWSLQKEAYYEPHRQLQLPLRLTTVHLNIQFKEAQVTPRTPAADQNHTCPTETGAWTSDSDSTHISVLILNQVKMGKKLPPSNLYHKQGNTALIFWNMFSFLVYVSITCPWINQHWKLLKTPEKLPCNLALLNFSTHRLCQIARKVQNQIQRLRANLSGINRFVNKEIPATSRMGVKSLLNKDN